MYKMQILCYTLGNHDYFLRNTFLSRKNIVAIFSVWSRGDFQHKCIKHEKSKKNLILITSKVKKKSKKTLEVSNWVGPALTLICFLENRPKIVVSRDDASVLSM